MFQNNLVKLVEIIIILKLLGKNDENSIVNLVVVNKKRECSHNIIQEKE